MSGLGNKEIMASNIRRHLDNLGMNVKEFATRMNFKYTTVLDWVNAKTYPRIDKIEMMASYFGVDKSDLIEEYSPSTKQSQPYYALTPKDERDIAKELEEMIAELSNNGGSLAFSKDDKEFDEETRELLIASLEQSLRIAKMEAKKRFTPKKYRN